MSLPNLFIVFAVFSALWAVVAVVLITRELDRRGMKTPFLLMRLFVFRNLGRYKEVTLKETGKVGALYYHYIIPINLALIFSLVALVTH